jgi:polyisoprenoid-binding protein YceI
LRWLRWVIGAAVAVVVLAVGGAFVYIHFIESPPAAKLTLAPDSTGSPAPVGPAVGAGAADGTWTIGHGSLAGYRVQEVLAGQNNTAVGRTSSVTGHLTISGASVTAATFTVDLRTVTSDSGQRDGQFNGRIMNTAQFPNAVFTLTKPIALGTLPKVNQIVHVTGVGTLAMHGVTKTVTATIQARDTGATIQVAGSIPVLFSDWSIANPSFSGFVTTKNHGLVEFSLVTTKS